MVARFVLLSTVVDINERRPVGSARTRGWKKAAGGALTAFLLVSLAWVNVRRSVSDSRCGQVVNATHMAETVAAAVDLYATQHRDRCPRDGVAGLVSERLLKKHPRDPWGEELIFTCPGVHHPDGADVVSKGPDRREGTRDDIRSWEITEGAMSDSCAAACATCAFRSSALVKR
jgi:hypothetical protein